MHCVNWIFLFKAILRRKLQIVLLFNVKISTVWNWGASSTIWWSTLPPTRLRGRNTSRTFRYLQVYISNSLIFKKFKFSGIFDDFMFCVDGLPAEIVDLCSVEIVFKEHILDLVSPAYNPPRSRVHPLQPYSQETLEQPGPAGLELILAL